MANPNAYGRSWQPVSKATFSSSMAPGADSFTKSVLFAIVAKDI